MKSLCGISSSIRICKLIPFCPSCKIFINPKVHKDPVYRDTNKEVHDTRYTVVVHYSIPKGYWDEFDI